MNPVLVGVLVLPELLSRRFLGCLRMILGVYLPHKDLETYGFPTLVR